MNYQIRQQLKSSARIDQCFHKTLLIVTHDPKLLIKLCLRSFLMVLLFLFSLCKQLIASFLHYECNCKSLSIPCLKGLPTLNRPLVLCVSHVAVLLSLPQTFIQKLSLPSSSIRRIPILSSFLLICGFDPLLHSTLLSTHKQHPKVSPRAPLRERFGDSGILIQKYINIQVLC